MARPTQKQSIYKIAQEAGVSISSVSCVLNNRPGVGDETRKRIAAVIDQYGYTRNYQRSDGRTIGLVLPGRWNDWYISAIVNGVMAYVAEAGVNIATIIYHSGGPKSLPVLLREHCCDAAVIVVPTRIISEIESIAQANLPIILIDARTEDVVLSDELKSVVGYVDNDSYQGSYDLTKYLLGLGHRSIAFVNRELPFRDQNSNARIDGWQDAMLESGVSPQELQRHLYQVKDSLAWVRTLPFKEKQFTALMANDDAMAMICLCVCYELGIKVPDDLSVTGFSNMSGSEFFAPPLTTVDQNIFKVGYEAARHVGALAMGQCEVPPRLILPTELVIRKSSGPVCQY